MIKIGHRGACGYEPENTLRSFASAMQLGVDMVELDVYTCKSGEIVVIHDQNVDRTTNGTGFVADKTLSELKTLATGKGEQIPTLSEVLDHINRKVKVNIELKGDNTAKPVFELIEKYIKQSDWSYNDFIISSFNEQELYEIRRLSNKLRIGVFVWDASKDFMELVAAISAYSIMVFFKLLTKEMLIRAQAKGLLTIVWTVNKREDIERMKLLGVDGIISDYPDKI